jgi:hypothetical protein
MVCEPSCRRVDGSFCVSTASYDGFAIVEKSACLFQRSVVRFVSRASHSLKGHDAIALFFAIEHKQ